MPNIKIVWRRVRYVCGAQYNNCIAQMFVEQVVPNLTIVWRRVRYVCGAKYNNCIAQKNDINYI